MSRKYSFKLGMASQYKIIKLYQVIVYMYMEKQAGRQKTRFFVLHYMIDFTKLA